MLTDEQKILFHAALSDTSGAGLMTDDPIVNHAVDQHKDDQNTPYVEDLYVQEIEAWRKSGGLILSLTKG